MDVSIKNEITNFFKKLPGALAVVLFGSQAKDQSTLNSDIDLAVFFDPHQLPTFDQFMDQKEALSTQLQTPVDLINLNKANPILKHQIFTQGTLLLNQKPSYLTEFASRSLVEYEDLKRIRAPIEKAILKGRVYG
ncbi:MAG: nucleotidyltransferase domain-containing protein [Deltaproteobacteria bacterium]|nr:nucleotidyltransferase domain-containing protein [Deltaproteobacteria bacterium]